MSGSGASNLGYAEIYPNSNVDGNYVNKTNTDYSAWFTDTTIPTSGSRGASNNAMAATGVALCQLGGGGGGGKKKRKHKSIKKNKGIEYIKKMVRHSKKMIRTRRRKLSGKRVVGGRRRKGTRRRSMRGGDSYANNVPYTPVFSTGGYLPSNLSALASPPPYHVLPSSGNCSGAYNHYKNPVSSSS